MKCTFPKLALAIAGLIPAVSAAYFEVDAPKRPETVQNVATGADGRFDYAIVSDKTTSPLTEIGQGAASSLSGFGKDVPLAAAMDLILPRGWQVRAAPNVDKNLMMSWGAGDKWIDVLRTWSAANHLATEVNWDRQQIVIEKQPELPGIRATYSSAGFKSKGAVAAEAVAQQGDQPPPKQYESLEAFLNEEVRVDLTQMPVSAIIRALLPEGWKCDDSAVSDQIRNMRGDLVTVQSRGEAISRLMMALNLTLYPYPQLQKVVVAPKQ